MERHQASEQRADGAHRRHDNASMGTALGQIGAVQGHKVADVVRDQDSAVCGSVLQERGVGPTLLMEIVDVVGINTVLSQLWREGGMDVFVQ